MGNARSTSTQEPGSVAEVPSVAILLGRGGAGTGRKSIEIGMSVYDAMGLGDIHGLDALPDDIWEPACRPYAIPAHDSDPAVERALHYVRTVPRRCHVVLINRRTGYQIPMLAPDAMGLLALALHGGDSRDLIAHTDDTAARRHRAALLREMSANALTLYRRRQIPLDVHESIRRLYRQASDAQRKRDSAKS